ncbi:unnamed protein product [Urochloa humidicola]
MIRPKGKRAWKVISLGSHKRLVNNILGRLCRDHFPGVVLHGGVYEPALTFHHYVVALDQADRDGRIFPNKAQRVIGELWDFYRLAKGVPQATADQVAFTVCLKLVKDLHYEDRVQAIIDYYANLKVKVKKIDARTMYLTREQYLSAIPWWYAAHVQYWEMIVDKWCRAEWEVTHNVCRDRRLQMPGPAHHQGSVCLDDYSEKWSASHGGEELNSF